MQRDVLDGQAERAPSVGERFADGRLGAPLLRDPRLLDALRFHH